jgi:CubicO group peptidase (beta-lactamase class C family)
MRNAVKYLKRWRNLSLTMRLACPGLVISIVLAVELTGCGGNGSPSAPAGSKIPSLPSIVDPLVNAAISGQGAPGVTVALAKNGTMLYTQAYGSSDIATHSSAQTNTIFEIGSITKQFTAALIMKLQEQGQLHVDDSVSAYLPDYKFPSAITLRMLLSHTSGLANYTTFTQYPAWAVHGVSEATVLSAVSQTPLLFPPGTQWSYSNSNYFLLGVIIEKLSGQSYEANLQQYLFQPLGLTNTYFSLPPPAQSAVGYTLSAGSVIPALVCDRSAAFAAGALSSNVSDLVAWDDALIHGKVVSPASFIAMTTPVSSSIPGGGAYGFGLFLRPFDNHPTIWHGGGINGFTAENNVFLDSGFSVVVLTNSDAANPDTIATEIMGAVCTSTQYSSNC